MLFLGDCLCVAGNAPETALDLEKQVVKSRQSIRSGKGELLRYRLSSAKKEQALHYEFAFEGKKLRYDTPQLKRIRNDGRMYRFFDDGKNDDELILTIRDADNPGGLSNVPDARLLGLAPIILGHLHAMEYHNIFERPDREDSVVRRESVKDTECWYVEVSHLSGKKSRFWIDENRGYNLLRCEIEEVFKGDRLVDTIDVELKLWGKTWFPKQIDYARTVNGRRHQMERIELANLVFGEDVDDELFEVASLDLPVGTIVSELPRPRNGSRVWNGAQLVSRDEIKAGVDMAQQGTSSILRSGFVVANCLLAVFFFVVFLKKRYVSTGN